MNAQAAHGTIKARPRWLTITLILTLTLTLKVLLDVSTEAGAAIVDNIDSK